MKTVVATASGLLLMLLVLPLAASLVVSVPSVQNALVQRLTTLATQRLGTRVAIDRVDVRLINHVELRGFYVEDFDGDTLLYVPRLVAPVTGLGLGKEQLSFGRVKLQGAQLWLRKANPDQDMNISRVVDSIRGGRPSNPDSRFRMRIASIEADSLTFGLLRGDMEQRAEGVDFSRFILRDVHARLDDFAISGDTIRMEINSLGGTERSGLRIDKLAAHPLLISRGAVTLADVDLRSRGSVLRLPYIRLVSADRVWSDFSVFSDSVAMGITMRSSRVTTDLVGAFVPAVAGWGVTLDDVRLYTRGVLAALSGGVERARTPGGTTLSLDFTSRGLPHIDEAYFDGRLRSFDTNGEEVASLIHSVTGREAPAGLSAILARLGAMSLVGGVTGTLGDFAAAGTLSSGAGNIDVEAKVTAGAGGTNLNGRASTARFELGRTLGAGDIGALAGAFTAAGTLSGGVFADAAPERAATPATSTSPATPATTPPAATSPAVKRTLHGTLHGEIDGLEFRDYTYTDIELDGTVAGERFGVELSARDPALAADLAASLDLSGRAPRYTVDLDLQKIDLAATKLDREDSVSVFSGHLAARMSGRGLDDANGRIELTRATYRSAGGSVSTPVATLDVSNGAAKGKEIILRSEFADAEFRSRTGYRDMLTYLRGFLGRYIPLPDPGGTKSAMAAHLAPPDGGDPAAPSNYSIFRANVKETKSLLSALAPSASIADGSKAAFLFNPYTGSFNLSAESEFVEYGGMLAADLKVTADNTADSLKVHLSGTDIYSGRRHIPRFELHGGAKGRTQIDLSLDGSKWRVAADSIGFDGERVGLDNVRLFSPDNPGQRLSATGVVSHLPSDTLHLRLDAFDLSPLGGLLGRGGGIDLAGRANGWLDVSGVTGNPGIDADIELRGLAAEGHQAPPLHFVSRPHVVGGVRFRLRNENSGADLIYGSLSTRGELDATVELDSLDASLLDPLLPDILENTRGKASARLRVGGTLRAVYFDGHIDASSFETTIAYTRARYMVEDARIDVRNSVLALPRTPVANNLGGTGELAMRIDMSDFRNIRADIDAWTNGMLAFDTGPGDSEAFYGRVFATGTADIRSDRMGTRIDISARTDAGTQFHLPLNAKSNVSWADFVVFADRRRAPADTTDVLARKKLAYERGLLAGSARARRKKPLELNLTASVTPAAEVHMIIDPNLGQGITGRGEGILDMKINPANDLFTMTGDYNISGGRFEFSMMDVFNKTFEIAPGSTLRWSGAADDALLSVDASYRVRTSLQPLAAGSNLVSSRPVPVDCIIRLRDRLSEPEITFDIALPLVAAEQQQIANSMNTQELKSMQFLSLLTTGSFATDNSITGQSANAGVMATGAVGFDILTNQLNNFLSSDDYDIYFRYRPQDNFATSQVDMGFSTRLWNDRLQLEIEGNYVDNRAAASVGTAAASNLAGDVSLTWVIDRAGNLRLKVFSQTIDRLNETQGLQESGIGIHYKKEFDNIRDIFRRSAGRTGNKKNRQKTVPLEPGKQ